MSKVLLAAIIVVCTVCFAMVVLDFVVVGLKKRKELGEGRVARYLSKNLFRLNAFVFLLLFCIVWLVPIVVGVIGSFTSQYAFENHPGELIPSDGFTFDNYIALFSKYDTNGVRLPVERWILNSFIVSTVTTVLYLTIAGFAAYAFVFLRFRGQRIVFYVLIFTMVIPGVATMTAQLANMANLGISKSLFALILPSLGGVGGLYLIRQFFLGIPQDLIESARIDGSSNLRIFVKIVLPLAKSVFLVQGLFCFMGAWNDLLWPQVILGTADKSLWTLQVGIAYIAGSKTANSIGINLASAIVSAVPILILYIFTQNKIIEGVAATGVKR